MYGFLYVTDKYEGLIVVGNPDLKGKNPGVGTLLDGNPQNNFMKPRGHVQSRRNPERRAPHHDCGNVRVHLCDRGLVVVDLDNPLAPRVTAEIGAPDLADPQGVAVQFRYAFVVDREGLKVLDVTDLAHPRIVPGAVVTLDDARNVNVSRTYAYVAGGKQGLALVNVEQPEHPRLDQMFTADGKIERCERREDRHGRCQRLRLSRRRPQRPAHPAGDFARGFAESYGFSPRPTPKLIATYRTGGPALAISRASTATAPWMKAATSSPCSDAAARARSTAPKPRGYISAMANSIALQTTRPDRRTDPVRLAGIL